MAGSTGHESILETISQMTAIASSRKVGDNMPFGATEEPSLPPKEETSIVDKLIEEGVTLKQSEKISLVRQVLRVSVSDGIQLAQGLGIGRDNLVFLFIDPEFQKRHQTFVAELRVWLDRIVDGLETNGAVSALYEIRTLLDPLTDPPAEKHERKPKGSALFDRLSSLAKDHYDSLIRSLWEHRKVIAENHNGQREVLPSRMHQALILAHEHLQNRLKILQPVVDGWHMEEALWNELGNSNRLARVVQESYTEHYGTNNSLASKCESIDKYRARLNNPSDFVHLMDQILVERRDIINSLLRKHNTAIKHNSLYSREEAIALAETLGIEKADLVVERAIRKTRLSAAAANAAIPASQIEGHLREILEASIKKTSSRKANLTKDPRTGRWSVFGRDAQEVLDAQKRYIPDFRNCAAHRINVSANDIIGYDSSPDLLVVFCRDESGQQVILTHNGETETKIPVKDLFGSEARVELDGLSVNARNAAIDLDVGGTHRNLYWHSNSIEVVPENIKSSAYVELQGRTTFIGYDSLERKIIVLHKGEDGRWRRCDHNEENGVVAHDCIEVSGKLYFSHRNEETNHNRLYRFDGKSLQVVDDDWSDDLRISAVNGEISYVASGNASEGFKSSKVCYSDGEKLHSVMLRGDGVDNAPQQCGEWIVSEEGYRSEVSIKRICPKETALIKDGQVHRRPGITQSILVGDGGGWIAGINTVQFDGWKGSKLWISTGGEDYEAYYSENACGPFLIGGKICFYVVDEDGGIFVYDADNKIPKEVHALDYRVNVLLSPAEDFIAWVEGNEEGNSVLIFDGERVKTVFSSKYFVSLRQCGDILFLEEDREEGVRLLSLEGVPLTKSIWEIVEIPEKKDWDRDSDGFCSLCIEGDEVIWRHEKADSTPLARDEERLLEHLCLLSSTDIGKVEGLLKDDPHKEVNPDIGPLLLEAALAENSPSMAMGVELEAFGPTRVLDLLTSLFPEVQDMFLVNRDAGFVSVRRSTSLEEESRCDIDSADPKQDGEEVAIVSPARNQFLLVTVFDNLGLDGAWSPSTIEEKTPETRSEERIDIELSIPIGVTSVLIPHFPNGSIENLSPGIAEFEMLPTGKYRARIKDASAAHLSYAQQITEPNFNVAVSEREYAKMAQSLADEHGEGIANSVGRLPVVVQTFLSSIKHLPPAARVYAIRNWVSKHFYYDWDNAEEGPKRYGASAPERLAMMQDRARDLKHKAKGDLGNKYFAGVCVDISLLLTAMFRESGFVAGIAKGFLVLDEEVTGRMRHMVSVLYWPNPDGSPHRVYIGARTQRGDGNIEVRAEEGAFDEALAELFGTSGKLELGGGHIWEEQRIPGEVKLPGIDRRIQGEVLFSRFSEYNPIGRIFSVLFEHSDCTSALQRNQDPWPAFDEWYFDIEDEVVKDIPGSEMEVVVGDYFKLGCWLLNGRSHAEVVSIMDEALSRASKRNSKLDPLIEMARKRLAILATGVG